jgi:hypothetical protein
MNLMVLVDLQLPMAICDEADVGALVLRCKAAVAVPALQVCLLFGSLDLLHTTSPNRTITSQPGLAIEL